jgi:predicted small secreted protein
MKKIGLFLVTCVLASSFLAGCGSGDDTAGTAPAKPPAGENPDIKEAGTAVEAQK